MGKRVYQAGKKTAVILAALFLLSGCGSVTEEMKTGRTEGIALLESGDYEGAVSRFDEVISQASRVTDFELDVIKYRAEAELKLEDYQAAAYTYGILSQVDEPKPEYEYLEALCLARGGNPEGAKAALEEGKALDESLSGFGYEEAMMAIGEANAASGDMEAADRTYQELVSQGHANTGIYNRWALSAMEAGNYEEALSYIETGLALSDDTARKELRFNEAVCCEYLGQYEQALSLFQAYEAEFGSDEQTAHEIAFLVTR